MTTRDRIEELIRGLEEHPEERDRLRRTLFGGEPTEAWSRVEQALAELSHSHVSLAESHVRLVERVDRLAESHALLVERVDRLAESHARLVERVDRLTEHVDRLAEHIDALTAKVDTLASTMGVVSVKIESFEGFKGRVLGEMYEKDKREHGFYIFRGGRDYGMEDRAREAALAGRLSFDEAEELARLDFAWEKRPKGQDPVVFAVEASIAIDTHDVDRAASRAALLEKVVEEGWRVLPVVMGGRFSGSHVLEWAKARGVAWKLEKPEEREEEIPPSEELERLVKAPPEKDAARR